LKLNFFLRIYENFSFLVSMLQLVFKDLRYFLSFFGFVVITFSLIFSVLLPEAGDSYTGISPVFSYLLMAFRTSIGDNDMENYQGASGVALPVWIAWSALMIIGNVVFFNFIVAVVSESYEKSMQTQRVL